MILVSLTFHFKEPQISFIHFGYLVAVEFPQVVFLMTIIHRCWKCSVRVKYKRQKESLNFLLQQSGTQQK